MPLDNFSPSIDDRRYNDILAELKTRIARYTPEWTPVWTDLNDSDPGVTMAQLFAWLSEMMLYRMGRVPELNYLKFLHLLGIELNPAEAAYAEVSFPVRDDYPAPTVIVPRRAQLTAEAADGGPPLVFETERAFVALKAKLAAVQAFDGYAHTDLSAENRGGALGFQPFGPLAGEGAALLLGFALKDPAEAFPAVELDLALWTAADAAEPLACGFPPSPAYAPARLRWEYWGDGGWCSLKLLKDDTRALTRTGHVLLNVPAKPALRRAVFGEVKAALFWLRAVVERGGYARPPLLLAIRTNTVGVRQAETVVDEVLGGSTGRRDQVFTINSAPVLADSLVLEVDEGEGYQPWTRVDDFFASGPDDRHYALNRTTGEVRFGDGINGHFPVANPSNPSANVVARVYRFGGGRRGNVAAQAINTLATPVDGIDAGQVGNGRPAFGGRDEESLAEAKKRAPQAIKSQGRAVTAEDFEHLARQAADIKRAKALPLFHPGFPGVQVPGVVTVIVVPDADTPNPMPSAGTLRTVCAYLDQRRLLTTELYVVAPSYQQVRVEGRIVATTAADLAEVSRQVEQSLLEYFHPLRGGEDGLGWPFGGTVYYSRVYQRVFKVAGVDRIDSLSIVLDGEPAAVCVDVPIAPNALLYATGHAVQVGYGTDVWGAA